MTPFRILDFDIENRPLAYMGDDYTSGEVTAIAWAWVGEKTAPRVMLLGPNTVAEILNVFVEVYDRADMVTGHYIRMHDLLVINGALMECGMPSLSQKLTCDTKLDLKARRHISASQENLAKMLGVHEPKIGLSNADWREANRLTPAGLKLTAARVAGDVQQHMALRAKLLELDLLGPPRVWYP